MLQSLRYVSPLVPLAVPPQAKISDEIWPQIHLDRLPSNLDKQLDGILERLSEEVIVSSKFFT